MIITLEKADVVEILNAVKSGTFALSPGKIVVVEEADGRSKFSIYRESKDELVLIALGGLLHQSLQSQGPASNRLSLLGRVYDALSRPRMVKVPVPSTHSIRSELFKMLA